MKKLEVEIDNCVRCPYLKRPEASLQGYTCGHPRTTKVALSGLEPIPTWCPLPNARVEDLVEPGC